jgi:prepilin-type N-terminal cleavage/methylation domain-containing protein
MPSRGFTVLELLVVLVIMGLAAGVVPVAWRVPGPATATASWPDVVTTARRLALARGRPLDLQIDADGRWLILAVPAGDTLRVGRGPEHPTPWSAARLRVDALGVCRPLVPPSGERYLFDMAACRAVGVVPDTGPAGALP